MNVKAVPGNIGALLDDRGMTRADLADGIGVSGDTLDRWLSGKRPITVYALYRTARFLSVTMDSLCNGID